MNEKQKVVGRTFACSDLHGMLSLYTQICDFLEPEDKVIFLGDAADRGSSGWTLIKAIYHNPQWIYLCGNHEDMLANAIDEWTWKRSISKKNRELLFSNGGKSTFYDWSADGAETEWADVLKELPIYYSYENVDGKTIILSHSGFQPYFTSNSFIPEERDDLIWDRGHIQLSSQFPWPSRHDNTILIHGHTPIQTLTKDYVPGALWYCNDHKICIDNASFHSGKTCLLDLDSFEEHIFETNN